LDARAPIPSSGNQSFSGRVYLHGSGDPGTTLPEVDPLLKACGFSPTAFSAAVTGTAQAGAASTITLAVGASAVTDFYRGCVITISSGTGSGNTARLITAYNGTTKVATVYPNWTVNPDATSVYSIPKQHIYKQVSSGIPTVTIYEYLHRRDAGNSKLRVHTGASGTFTLTTNVNEGCYFEFSMTGSLIEPTDVSAPAAATYQDTRPIPFNRAIQCAFNGTTIKLRNFSFDAGNEISQIENANAQFGLDIAAIVRRRSGGTFQAPMELQSVRNVFSSWFTGAESKLGVIWGSTAGNRFAILADHLIHTGAQDADVNGFGYEGLPYRTNRQNDSMLISYW
jgi:hypothetical protein